MLPAIGELKVRHLDRGRLKALLAAKRGEGLAPSREQLSRFLAAVQQKVPRFYPLFFFLSRTGLRLGEARGLQWGDLDLERREVRVERAVSTDGQVDTPKSGHGRSVDLSLSLREVLQRHKAQLAEAWLKRKKGRDENGEEKPKGEQPPSVFPSEAWTPMDHCNVEKAFKGALKAAGLPAHFSPHSLRHSFASLLLADGVSPAYVQEQLGHASIELTVGTYGRWLRKAAPGAVDRLDGHPQKESGSKVAANSAAIAERLPEVVDGVGAPRLTRTADLRFRKPLLYPAELWARRLDS